MNCSEVEKGEITEKYLLGELNEEQSRDFEEHYFSCAVCYEALEAGAALKAELSESRWQVRSRTSSVQPRPQWVWAAAAAAVVVLALGLLFWFRLPDLQGPNPMLLAELSEVEPPPYTPKRLRSGERETEGSFREAMVAYQERRFADAIPLLTAVTKSENADPGAHFYLGTCLLLTNRPDDAVKSLDRVLELGETRYADWARFYRAKGFLRLDDMAAARTDLAAVVNRNGELAASAEEILDQL